MGALLEYMTKQIGDKKILDFYEYWVRESKRTFLNLMYLASEGNLMTFQHGYDDFITSCCLGEVIPGLLGTDFTDGETVTFKDGTLKGKFKGEIYPYGSHIRKLIVRGFKDTSLKDKQLVFKPLSQGVHLQLIMQTNKDIQLLSKFAETPDSIVIDGSDLEKLRRVDEKDNEIRVTFYILTATYESSKTLPYELNVELGDKSRNDKVSRIKVSYVVQSWAGPESDDVYFLDTDNINVTQQGGTIHIAAERKGSERLDYGARDSQNSLEIDLSYNNKSYGDISKLKLSGSGKYTSGNYSGKSYSYKLETGTIPNASSSAWAGWKGYEKDGMKIVSFESSNEST